MGYSWNVLNTFRKFYFFCYELFILCVRRIYYSIASAHRILSYPYIPIRILMHLYLCNLHWDNNFQKWHTRIITAVTSRIYSNTSLWNPFSHVASSYRHLSHYFRVAIIVGGGYRFQSRMCSLLRKVWTGGRIKGRRLCLPGMEARVRCFPPILMLKTLRFNL